MSRARETDWTVELCLRLPTGARLPHYGSQVRMTVTGAPTGGANPVSVCANTLRKEEIR